MVKCWAYKENAYERRTYLLCKSAFTADSHVLYVAFRREFAGNRSNMEDGINVGTYVHENQNKAMRTESEEVNYITRLEETGAYSTEDTITTLGDDYFQRR